jgi:hypothetical protein
MRIFEPHRLFFACFNPADASANKKSGWTFKVSPLFSLNYSPSRTLESLRDLLARAESHSGLRRNASTQLIA